MQLKAVVQFEGGLAHYEVYPESNGIYQARLLRFEGNTQKTPPEELILVRGYRQWAGSDKRQDLLNELGSVIEEMSIVPHPSEVNTRPERNEKR